MLKVMSLVVVKLTQLVQKTTTGTSSVLLKVLTLILMQMDTHHLIFLDHSMVEVMHLQQQVIQY